jgi:hypothetical protein
MKKLGFLFLLAISVLFTSCLDDAVNKQEYIDMGVITSLSSQTGLVVKIDEGFVLKSLFVPNLTELEIGKRVMVMYKIDRTGTDAEDFDYLIEIVDISVITVKPIFMVDDTNRDTLVSDLITINQLWISGKYMNVAFSYWNSNKVHYFNLAYDPTKQDYTGGVVLEFMHDANGDNPVKRSSEILSFDLSSIDWSGNVPYKILFRFKDRTDGLSEYKMDYTPVANGQ